MHGDNLGRWIIAMATVFFVPFCIAAEPSPEQALRPQETRDPGSEYVAPDTRRTEAAKAWQHERHVSIQVNVDGNGDNIIGDAANEPSIAVSPVDRTKIVIGWRQFDTITSNFRQAGRGYSTDGGRTWTFPGVLEPGVFRSDPVLAAAADGTIYYDSLTVDGNYSTDVFTSTDGGATFDGAAYAFGGDKQWLAVDRSNGPGRGHLYQPWDYAGCCGDDWFNRSTSGAGGFESPVQIPAFPFWGVVDVAADGTVYVAGVSNTFYPQFVVTRSSTLQDDSSIAAFDAYSVVDLGGEQHFNLGSGPNPGGLLGQVWLAVDRSSGPHAGNIYVLCSVDPPSPDPLDVHFARSTDGGVTWSPPVRVNDDASDSGAWQWFGTMSVAPDGRIDVIWNDTRNDSGGLLSELTYAYSTDGGLSWSANEVLSPTFNPHLGWPQQDKLGDYFHMVSDRVGADLAYAATFNGEQDVYYLRIGDRDCNDNGVGDADDILLGTSSDADLDGIPDECRTDRDGDGAVDALDNCPDDPNPDQIDSDGNGMGDVCDSLIFADGFELGNLDAWQ